MYLLFMFVRFCMFSFFLSSLYLSGSFKFIFNIIIAQGIQCIQYFFFWDGSTLHTNKNIFIGLFVCLFFFFLAEYSESDLDILKYFNIIFLYVLSGL